MKKLFRSTTALGMSLALAWPATGFAQDLDTCNVTAEIPLFPCTVDGTVIRSAEELSEIVAETEVPQAQQQDSVAVERGNVDAQDEQARKDAEAAAAAQAQAEADAAAQAEADAAAKAEADAAAQAEAVAAAKAQAEADAAAIEAARAEADAEAANQAQADADAAAAAQAQADANAAAQVEAERLAAEQAQAEADRAALREERAAARQAELDAAAAAAAAAAEGQSNGEVVTEEIAEGQLRSSSEEFETAVTGDGAEARSDDDSGLSKFEKALLLGLEKRRQGSQPLW